MSSLIVDSCAIEQLPRLGSAHLGPPNSRTTVGNGEFPCTFLVQGGDSDRGLLNKIEAASLDQKPGSKSRTDRDLGRLKRAEAERGEEAAGGFEPPNDGFANRCLTTWRRGQ